MPGQPKDVTRARLLAYLRVEAPFYVFGVAMLLLTNACTAGVPYLTKLIFDALEGAGGADGGEAVVARVSTLALGIVGLAAGLAVFRTLSRISIFNGGRRVEYSVRNDVYAHLQKLGPAFFGRMAVGDLVSRLSNDITAVRLLGGPGVLNIANTAIVYVAAVFPMLALSPSLTVWALAPLGLVFLSTRVVGPRIYARSFAAQERLSRLSALANESIGGIQVVQAYARELSRDATFEGASSDYRDAYLSFVLYRSVLLPILGGMGGLGTLTILYFGGSAVIAGTLSLGAFVAFLGYLAMLMWPTIALGWMITLWQRGRAAMDRLSAVLDELPEVVDGGDDGAVELAGGIEFRGLDFSWTTVEGGQRQVLHGIDLVVEPGQQVLVVGPSGSGKSTLVSLLPHLAAVPEGRLLLDGHDIGSFPLRGLRRRIAFVPQESFLFSMTVGANIGFGQDEPTPEQVRRAAELAALTGDVERFPNGYETVVGERGVSLSGGQRQRMTIARAAMLDPAIWVFDDCLSSVDAGTEQSIIRNLRRMTGGATALFVTHRLLGFEGVDKVVVLMDGRVAEQGRHDELMASGGWYARLYRKQKLDQELAAHAVPKPEPSISPVLAGELS